MEFQPVIALGGLVVGVMIGLSGMGGGALMTPLLILLGIRPVVAVGTDLVVGLLVGMSSIGSGTLLVAALSLAMRRPFAQIIGIDVTHGALLTAAAAAAHLAVGHVDMPLTVNVLVGTVPGVVIGSRLSVRVPDRRLGTVVAMVILVLGISLL